MPANCGSINADHRNMAYDLAEVDITRCVVKSEGKKEVRVQAFFVLKKDSNVKGRKQKSFSISKFGLDGAWSRANRCKEFIEQLGRFPVDENEIEAFQGKTLEASSYNENRPPNASDWPPYLQSVNKQRRIVRDYGSVLLDSGTNASSPTASKWRDPHHHQPPTPTATSAHHHLPHRRGINKVLSTPTLDLSGSTPSGAMKGSTIGRSSLGSAYFPCPPPLDSHSAACLSAHHCFANPNIPPTPPSKTRLLEQLTAGQLRYLLRFLEPAGLSALERGSKHLRKQVQETEAWKLVFFNCIPHMADLARLSSLSQRRIPFPFEKASGLLYKGFFAFENATRHCILWRDLRSTISNTYEERLRCHEDEEMCNLTIRRSLQSINYMCQRPGDENDETEVAILKSFQTRIAATLEKLELATGRSCGSPVPGSRSGGLVSPAGRLPYGGPPPPPHHTAAAAATGAPILPSAPGGGLVPTIQPFQ